MKTELEKIVVYGCGHFMDKHINEWMTWGWGIKGGELQEILPGKESLVFIQSIEKYLPDNYKDKIDWPVHSGEQPDIQILLTEFKDQNKVYESLQKYFPNIK